MRLARGWVAGCVAEYELELEAEACSTDCRTRDRNRGDVVGPLDSLELLLELDPRSHARTERLCFRGRSSIVNCTALLAVTCGCSMCKRLRVARARERERETARYQDHINISFGLVNISLPANQRHLSIYVPFLLFPLIQSIKAAGFALRAPSRQQANDLGAERVACASSSRCCLSLASPTLRIAAMDDEDKERFQIELEFVQALANPLYLRRTCCGCRGCVEPSRD